MATWDAPIPRPHWSRPPPLQCCAYWRRGQSITFHPTQPPPSPEPHLTQPASSTAFFSHQNRQLRADCSKILPMGEQGRARHGSWRSVVPALDQGCPARGADGGTLFLAVGCGACPRCLAAGCMGPVAPKGSRPTCRESSGALPRVRWGNEVPKGLSLR